MSIHIICTGGTFDKEYNELTGELFFNDTHVPEMLKLGRCLIDIQIEKLFMIDSLHMNDDYRSQISSCCLKVNSNRIIITHGTDTITDTAQYLARTVPGKTIVLTGALVPYKFGSSDGLFNLGCAIAFVQTLPTGVYVSMNGKYFKAGKVRKNLKKGVFEGLE